jgi:hypothetical protein
MWTRKSGQSGAVEWLLPGSCVVSTKIATASALSWSSGARQWLRWKSSGGANAKKLPHALQQRSAPSRSNSSPLWKPP